jgi:PD-(D/E)XK nuclease superfamily
MTTSSTVRLPPQIPSKYDIIPIHASDLGAFLKCRRRWNWSSPMRNNLVPDVSQTGVVLPLWFGSGIHWALRHYYDPILSRDPVETFKTWWHLQWHGGLVPESWLETIYDRSPKEVKSLFDLETSGVITNSEPMYKVKGLKDILMNTDIEPFEEHRQLGIGMMEYYKNYAEEFDDFEVIMVEHTFSVPITNHETGEIFRAVDPRDGTEKEVHLRGTQDAIIRSLTTGKFGILEHKTTARIDEEYFLKLDKDPQVTTYMYAGEREAAIHDLDYKRIDFTIYNAIRKAFPRPPTMVRSGLFSIDRSKESTTPKMLQEFIEDNGIQVIVDEDPKLQAYVEYVNTIGHEQFIVRNNPQKGSKPVTRNRFEIKNAGIQMYYKAKDMLNEPVVYPNPTGDRYCTRCPFRGPCIAIDDGSDYAMMLSDGFERNWTR